MTNLLLDDELVEEILAISSHWKKTPSEFIEHLLASFRASCWLFVPPPFLKRRKRK